MRILYHDSIHIAYVTTTAENTMTPTALTHAILTGPIFTAESSASSIPLAIAYNPNFSFALLRAH